MTQPNINDVLGELGQAPRVWNDQPKKPRSWSRSESRYPAKAPAPQAQIWSSLAAESWMSLAGAQGFDPPYNVNYLAREFEVRVARDPFFKPLDEDHRDRLLDKMVALFWKIDAEDGFTYVRAGDTSNKIKELFLVECWDDVRQYAYDSLRAKYLKEHGRRVPPPDYGDHRESVLFKTERKIKFDTLYERELREREETREFKKLDEHSRSVLASGKRRTD